VHGYEAGYYRVVQKEYFGVKPGLSVTVHEAKKNGDLDSFINSYKTTYARPVATLSKFSILMKDDPSYAFIPYIPHKGCINQIAAVYHRFGMRPKKYSKNVMSHFTKYAKCVIEKFFPSLSLDDLIDHDEWLKSSSYNGTRQDKLRRLRLDLRYTKEKHVQSKSFIKFEGYDKPKWPRGINSPGDECKTFLGPMIHSIDKKTFSMPWFVKGMDPKDLPEKMYETFGYEAVLETDFSSFEAHHYGPFAEIILFWMMHMIRNVYDNATRRMIHRMISGINKCIFKEITVEMPQALMSGVLWTSSANGVLNLLIMSYLQLHSYHPTFSSSELADKFKSFVGFVEGDDGITKDFNVNQDYIDALGVQLKFVHGQNFGDVSFCGKTCDITTRPWTIITDPRKVIHKFSYLDTKYAQAKDSTHKALLRNKALSFAYCYQNCPIVGPLAYKYLEMTKSIDPRKYSTEMDFMEKWVLKAHNEKIWQNPPKISPESREAVHKHFGLSPEAQLLIERQICESKDNVMIDSMLVSNDQQYWHCVNYQSNNSQTFISQNDCDPNIIETLRKGRMAFELDAIRPYRRCTMDYVGVQYGFHIDAQTTP
jgi:hypothetical protein